MTGCDELGARRPRDLSAGARPPVGAGPRPQFGSPGEGTQGLLTLPAGHSPPHPVPVQGAGPQQGRVGLVCT